MGAFFKRVGLGVLYIIGCPFFLLLLAIFTVYGVLIFIFNIIKWLILFFTGRSLFDDLPEDKKAKEIIAQRDTLNNPNNQASYQREPQPANYQNNVYGFQMPQTNNDISEQKIETPLPFERNMTQENTEDFEEDNFISSEHENDQPSLFNDEPITAESHPINDTVENGTTPQMEEHVSSNNIFKPDNDEPIMGFYKPRGGEDDD